MCCSERGRSMPVKELGCQVPCIKGELCITKTKQSPGLLNHSPHTHLPASVSHNGIIFQHALQENEANSGHSVLGFVLTGLCLLSKSALWDVRVVHREVKTSRRKSWKTCESLATTELKSSLDRAQARFSLWSGFHLSQPWACCQTVRCMPGEAKPRNTSLCLHLR